MKEIQLKKIIKVCPDCGYEIISFISDDEPLVKFDDSFWIFVLCPNCGDYVAIIKINAEDFGDEFAIEDYKYDLEIAEGRVEEIKKQYEQLPHWESDVNKYKFIINKIKNKKE